MKTLTYYFSILVILTFSLLSFGDSDNSWDNGSKNKRVFMGDKFEIAPDETLDEVVVIGSKGIVKGKVEKLVVIGSDVSITDTASVIDTFVTIGSHTEIDPKAQIKAEQVRIALPGKGGGSQIYSRKGLWSNDLDNRENWFVAGIIWALLSGIFSLLIGFLYLNIAPRFHADNLAYIKANSVAAFGIGILGYLLVIPSILLLVVTIVGILLIPLFIVLLILSAVLGYLTVSAAIGERLKIKLGSTNEVLWQMAAGVVMLKLVGLIPFLGTVVVFILSTAGFGAVLRHFFQKSHRHFNPS